MDAINIGTINKTKTGDADHTNMSVKNKMNEAYLAIGFTVSLSLVCFVS